MPQAIISLNDEENEIIIKLSNKWDISKHETIKRIIRERSNRMSQNGL